MEKVKNFGRNLSIRKSLVIYVAVFAILALVLSVSTASLCNKMIDAIRESYPLSGEKYYLTNEQGEQLGDGTYIGRMPAAYTESDEHTIDLLSVIPVVATPLYSALCIIAAVLLFYKNKLQEPLTEFTTPPSSASYMQNKYNSPMTSVAYGLPARLSCIINDFLSTLLIFPLILLNAAIQTTMKTINNNKIHRYFFLLYLYCSVFNFYFRILSQTSFSMN